MKNCRISCRPILMVVIFNFTLYSYSKYHKNTLVLEKYWIFTKYFGTGSIILHLQTSSTKVRKVHCTDKYVQVPVLHPTLIGVHLVRLVDSLFGNSYGPG